MWMMGASLNPQSDMAKEMDTVLKNEVEAHSAFDPAAQPSYHGVPLPGGGQSKRNRAAVSVNLDISDFFFGANALESTQVKCRKIEFLAFKIEFLAFKIKFFAFQIKFFI